MQFLNKLRFGVVAIFGLIVIGFTFYRLFFVPPQKQAEKEIFVVARTMDSSDITTRLKKQGLIKRKGVFKLALYAAGGDVKPGGYQVSKAMNVWQMAKKLTSEPEMKWVTVPEGLRKEEIANKLAETLGWSEKEKNDWINKYTAMDYDYLEGVYFPDTYLISIDESGLEVAERFRRRFDEKFDPYYDKFLEENIKWTTGLTLASLIQREAAGKEDMALISGVLWNRLIEEMKLEVDATVQYARDNREEITSDFWKPISPQDKEIDSQYNTYMYKGLPPFPICNPGLDAIEAAINPQDTDCFYYLHDPDRQIHCAETYEEHLENIDKYLR
jgi:UPF0755 protein